MRIKERTIRTRRDKNSKGEIIFKVVASYVNKEGKSRQEFRLYWGKLPTSALEKLILKYNKAIRFNRHGEIGKIWEKIIQLKNYLRERRTNIKEWLGKSNLTQETDPISLFFNSVVNLKRDFEKVLLAQALEKVGKKDIQKLQNFIANTEWLAEVRTHIKQKVKRMMPQTAREQPNRWNEFVSRTAATDSTVEILLKQNEMEDWDEEKLRKFIFTTKSLKKQCDLAERLLMGMSADD